MKSVLYIILIAVAFVLFKESDYEGCAIVVTFIVVILFILLYSKYQRR